MEPLQNQSSPSQSPFQSSPSQPASMNSVPITSTNTVSTASSSSMPTTSSNITPPLSVDRNVLNSEHHKKVGPIIATLVIVLIIIIGALYILASRVSQQTAPIDTSSGPISAASQTASQEEQTANASATIVPIVAPVTGTADDLQSLQADLNASVTGVDGQEI